MSILIVGVGVGLAIYHYLFARVEYAPEAEREVDSLIESIWETVG